MALSFYQRYKFRKLVVVPFLFIVSLVSVLYFASILTWKYSFEYSSIIRLKNDDCVYIGNSNKVNLIIPRREHNSNRFFLDFYARLPYNITEKGQNGALEWNF